MAEFSDGSPLATQWPIPPLNFFDYEIHLLPGDAGTYFYHSHIGMQALTATGALIVEDCGSPPYAYDDERVLLFHEHFTQTDKVFEEGLLAAPLRFGGEVVALMLNGAGVGTNHTAGELGPGDASCQLPVVEVAPGQTYRLRFIGATSLAHSILAFEGHDNLTVVAVDGGQYTQPASTERMQLGSGQRFDVLLTTKSAAELAAEGNKTDFYIQFETRDRPAVFRGYGVLRYNMAGGSNSSSAPASPPPAPIFNLPNATYDWLEGPAALQPLTPDPAYPTLAEVTRRIVVDVRQLINPSTNQTIWTLNDLTWNEHVAYPVPLLVDIYLRGDAAMPDFAAAAASNLSWDPRTKSFPAEVGEVLEIVLQNTGSLVNGNGGVDVHPFHAHGEHYFDIASGNGTYDPVAVEAARVAAGGGAGVQPVRRDTTMLYRYGTRTTAGADAGYRVWRLRVSEPGVWMVHCHTLQHMVMGRFLDFLFFPCFSLDTNTLCSLVYFWKNTSLLTRDMNRHAIRLGVRQRQRHPKGAYRPQRRLLHLRRKRRRGRAESAAGVRAVRSQRNHVRCLCIMMDEFSGYVQNYPGPSGCHLITHTWRVGFVLARIEAMGKHG